MAYATLEVLAGRVREDLERYFQNRRARLAERLRQLLRLLLTAEIPEGLAELACSGEARGLQTHLKVLEKHLRTESQLPEALCARYKYRTSESQARKRYRVSKRTWDYFHELAKELDWKADLQVPLVAYQNYPWHDELEERFVELEVILDTRALEGMLICALEGYLSPRKPRRKGHEIYGITLGMTRDVYRRRLRDGICITRYISVMRSHPQLSADVDFGFVVPNLRSLSAILSATAALYPQYQAVGDFHSHPYDEFWQLDGDKGWNYSASDEQANIILSRAMSELGHEAQVSFVIAIARSNQRVTRSHYKGLRNTTQMVLGNCRVIVAAYRSLGSGRLTKSNIRLMLSGMT